MLGACSVSDIEKGSGRYEIEMKALEVQAACEAAQKPDDYAGLSELAIVLLKSQKEMTKMVAMALGKSPNPCAPTTSLHDVQIVEVKERNETARTGIKTTGQVVMTGLVVDGAVKLQDNAGKNGGVHSGNDTTYGDHSSTPTSDSYNVTNPEAPVAP
jgi:hypothetical protein